MISCVLGLVLGLDVSGSVDTERWIRQRNGHAEAFRSELIQQFVESNGPISVSIVTFADNARVSRDWTLLQNRLQLLEFSDYIYNMDRPDLGRFDTNILDAVEEGIALHENNSTCITDRMVIDIAADGTGVYYDGDITRQAEEKGIQINGLVISSSTWDTESLTRYFRQNIITSDGFIIVADGFEDVGRAVRRKLEIEILGGSYNEYFN